MIYYVGLWLFSVSYYTTINSVSPLEPIDIVTEKITGKPMMHQPPIVLMIPEKDPIYRRQRFKRETRPALRSEVKDGMFSRFYDSFVDENNLPAITSKPRLNDEPSVYPTPTGNKYF